MGKPQSPETVKLHEFLQAHQAHVTVGDVAELFGMSSAYVGQQAKALGIKMLGMKACDEVFVGELKRWKTLEAVAFYLNLPNALVEYILLRIGIMPGVEHKGAVRSAVVKDYLLDHAETVTTEEVIAKFGILAVTVWDYCVELGIKLKRVHKEKDVVEKVVLKKEILADPVDEVIIANQEWWTVGDVRDECGVTTQHVENRCRILKIKLLTVTEQNKLYILQVHEKLPPEKVAERLGIKTLNVVKLLYRELNLPWREAGRETEKEVKEVKVAKIGRPSAMLNKRAPTVREQSGILGTNPRSVAGILGGFKMR